MPTCFALFCTHDSRREPCRMFQFPSDSDLKKQWLNSTRRTDIQLKSSSRICSCHFAKGKKQNGPTLFAWTNYISKIRRDLDKPKEPEKEQKEVCVQQDQLTIPVEDITAPGIEIEIKTEREEEVAQIVADLPFSILNNGLAKKTQKTPPRPIIQEKDEAAVLKEVEARVNNDHRLVSLRVENLIMLHEIGEYEKKLSNSSDAEAYQHERVTVEKLMNNEVLLHCYTGLTSFSVFRFLIYIVTESESDLKYTKWSVVNLHLEEQLLIMLMKLRCNFGFSDIAYRFRVSSSTVKNVIWTFVDGLHALLYEEALAKKPFPYFIGDSTELGEEFKDFSNCRIILGCVAVESEASRHSSANDYKQRTLRGLVGVSPLGDFIFASELHPENVTLREMVEKSHILEKLSPGDLILCLEDLNIKDLLPPDIDLNVPLLTQDDASLNERKIWNHITKATHCLDLAIEKLRRYSVLDRILLSYRVNATKIFQLCCALVNLESSVIEES